MEVEASTVLNSLIRLQDIESELRRIDRKVREAPEEIEKLKAQMEDERKIVRVAEDSISRSMARRKQLEKDVEEAKLRLSNLKTRLMEVKTNTEYQAMLHDIEFAEHTITEKEDGILEEMLNSDQLNEQLREAQKEYAQIESQLKAQQSELQVFVEQSKIKRNELIAEMGALEREIPPEFLDRYRRIAAVRNGKALAPVIDNCCHGCHVRLRPQLYAEIIAGRDIILCENCNRILYNPA